jgi:hypothetical protein
MCARRDVVENEEVARTYTNSKVVYRFDTCVLYKSYSQLDGVFVTAKSRFWHRTSFCALIVEFQLKDYVTVEMHFRSLILWLGSYAVQVPCINQNQKSRRNCKRPTLRDFCLRNGAKIGLSVSKEVAKD